MTGYATLPDHVTLKCRWPDRIFLPHVASSSS